MKLREWNVRLHGLVVFRSLLDDPVVAKLLDLTDRMEAGAPGYGPVCDAAAQFEAALFEHTTNWGSYLSAAVLEAETVCVRQAASGTLAPALQTALDSELAFLQALCGLTLDELLAAAPDCGAKRMDAMAERDGSVLLAPVRFNWEALYVNADVLEANGVAVPTNYDELIIACASLAQKGILPLANAMCEWPEIVLDCTAMIGAPADQYGQQTSLDGAKAVTTALTQVGAFGLDPWNLTDEQAKQAFMEGAAAMRFDGSDLAELVPEARQEHVVAVSLAGMDGQARTALVGTPSYGLALTRACWQDSARREAALSLAQKLLGGDGAAMIGAPAYTTALGKSVAQMTASATACAGLLYDLNPEHFDEWSESVVSALMAL